LNAGNGFRSDIVTIKYDLDGNVVWEHVFDETDDGTHGTDEPKWITIDPFGDIIVTGESFINVFFANSELASRSTTSIASAGTRNTELPKHPRQRPHGWTEPRLGYHGPVLRLILLQARAESPSGCCAGVSTLPP